MVKVLDDNATGKDNENKIYGIQSSYDSFRNTNANKSSINYEEDNVGIT